MRKLLEALKFRPRTCVWEITLRCNLNCLHCGSRAGKARGAELSTEEALDLADQLADLGPNLVTLSGGEPLLRDDWPQITRRLVDRGINVNLISNGILLDEDTVSSAREVGLKNFLFSLDGTASSHDRIRNRKGAFELLDRTTRICREQGFPFAAVTQVCRLNRGELEEMYEQVKEWGAFAWQVQPSIPMGNYLDNPGLVLEPEDLPEVYPRLAALFELAEREGKVEPYAADGIGYFGDVEPVFRRRGEPGFWYGCMAGCQVIGLEANGNVKPCLTMQSDDYIVGNIRERALREIWEDDESFAFNRKFEPEMLEGFCATCRYGEICRAGCRWQALCSSGSLFDNRYCYYRVQQEMGRVTESTPTARGPSEGPTASD